METFVSIVRRPVKHARLRVSEDATVLLVAPDDFTQAQINTILDRKAGWINSQVRFFRAHPPAPPPAAGTIMLWGEPFTFTHTPSLGRQVAIDVPAKTIRSGADLSAPEALEKWYRTFARTHLATRTRELAQKHGFTYGRLSIRAQRRKWGNCSTNSNISLNWRLVTAPRYVADYLILHELMHTRIMNHTHRFWAHLRAICPDHAKATAWLQSNRPK